MLKIFLSSHGHFASGIKSSVDILLGDSSNVTIFDAYVDQSTVQEHLEAFFKTVKDDDQVFLLSDLYGGSVNQIMSLFLDRPNITLIAGVNLVFVLELVSREEVTAEEVEEIITASRDMLRIVKLESETDDNNDFF
jgi:mannose/fructose-specific phosphotransferase system component IIA